ncbi:pyruvate dehydrogenase [Frankia sp. Cppng1_Ct_nod]|uniref:pyruvate dehydrogenase n=1 Tax=Frankia sp. Cppng1_Ct_nod TaxID=2897162 RepID=UPI00202517E8|nr:pyruvate dehydrogenase [Frankia sp. Cppng1_Ct_nod]
MLQSPAQHVTGTEPLDLRALTEIERRLRGLATAVADTAVADTAVSSIVTVLWFDALRAGDRVWVPPGAFPLVDAAHRLLGRSDLAELATLTGRAGPTVTVWAAIAARLRAGHPGLGWSGRQICLLDHARLVDGSHWESVTDPRVRNLGELLWVVTVRTPATAAIATETGVAGQAGFFTSAGWQVLTVGYGRALSALFHRPGGQALRHRLDGMTSADHEVLVRSRGPKLRRGLAGHEPSGAGITRLLDELSDDEIATALRDVGGNDLPLLVDAFDEVDPTRPTVLFVHVGERPDAAIGPRSDEVWEPPPADSPAFRLAARIGQRIGRRPVDLAPAPAVPAELDRSYLGRVSTLAAFGTLLRDLAGSAPAVASRMVTAATADAVSALTGWMAATGTWSTGSPTGQDGRPGRHLAESASPGILGDLLGGLGSTWHTLGRPVLPIGVTGGTGGDRALAGWCARTAPGAQSVLVVLTDPSAANVGSPSAADATVVDWEPAFAQDLAWCTLEAIGRLGRPDGHSTVLRVSPCPLEQALAAIPTQAAGRARRRAQVLAGGYRLRSGGTDPVVTLVGVGAVMADVLAAADELAAGLGRGVGVICLTSPGLVFQALQARRGLRAGTVAILDEIFPADRRSPLVTVTAGDPRTLGFLAGVHGDPISTLGFGMALPVDATTIVGAALDLLDETEG